MTTRLTYTSGSAAPETDAAFEAARLGIEDRCRGEDLGLAPVPDAAAGSAHAAACHAVAATAPTEEGAPA